MGYKTGIETKKRIYQAALRLFTENGYYQTTMRMIAAEAEVNLGLCTYHFKTKDNIVKTFYRHHLLFVRDFLARRTRPRDTCHGLLTETALNYALLFSSRLLLTLFLEGITADDLSRAYSGETLRKGLSERIPPDKNHDDTWFLMGSVILSAASRAIFRKWREKKLDRTPKDLMAFLLSQIYGYFGIADENTEEEIHAVLDWIESLNLKNLEKDLLRYCLEEEFSQLSQG